MGRAESNQSAPYNVWFYKTVFENENLPAADRFDYRQIFYFIGKCVL